MASVPRTEAANREVRWKTPEHRSRKRRFATKPEALRFRTQVEHQVLSQSYVDPSAGRITFKAYAEQWRAVQVHVGSNRTSSIIKVLVGGLWTVSRSVGGILSPDSRRRRTGGHPSERSTWGHRPGRPSHA